MTLYVLSSAITFVFLLIDLSIPLGVAGGVPYITVVLLSLWMPSTKSTFFTASVCSALTVIGFFFSPPGGEMWKVHFNRGLALYAIWVTAILIFQRKMAEKKRENAILQREKAMAQIKVLHGLLPICASCKSIRDDKGYWSQIETYISEHSEAIFSHGICPDCSKKLYPEFHKE